MLEIKMEIAPFCVKKTSTEITTFILRFNADKYYFLLKSGKNL